MTQPDQQSSGWPIDCVAQTLGKARIKNGWGIGVDRIFLFYVIPTEYTTPSGTVYADQAATPTAGVTYICRNKYFTEIEVGDQLVIILGADGIGTVVSWECPEEEDEEEVM